MNINLWSHVMRRKVAAALAALMMSVAVHTAPALAQGRDDPPPRYDYWEGRRNPPPGHEFRNWDERDASRWDDRRRPPPNWNEYEWRMRQRWLRQHGHDDDDHNAAAGLIIGAILGFALGAAVVDSQEHQGYAQSRLNDPAWIAYCARKYRSFDPYTGTYLGYDGLRHYCR